MVHKLKFLIPITDFKLQVTTKINSLHYVTDTPLQNKYRATLEVV